MFKESRGTYGYRRIAEALKIKYGVIFNHKRVARIMHKFWLQPKYLKAFKSGKCIRQWIGKNVKKDLVKRNFKVDKPNKVWVTDITFLIFKNKRLYLSTILDLYDRKVVSYCISKYNNIPLVIETLNKAVKSRKNLFGLILHSDQGFQYTSYEYKHICECKGIQISMSRKGTPIDDSPIESFHAILKKETFYNNDYNSLEEYRDAVIWWINFYNTSRIKNRKERKF